MKTYEEGHAGPVTVFPYDEATGWITTKPPYTKAERAEIIRQGKDRPRPLTHDETTRAVKNRRVAREDLLAMERWHSSQNKGGLRGRALWLARHPGPQEPWVGKENSERWR